jgi:hypothetical protein
VLVPSLWWFPDFFVALGFLAGGAFFVAGGLFLAVAAALPALVLVVSVCGLCTCWFDSMNWLLGNCPSSCDYIVVAWVVCCDNISSSKDIGTSRDYCVNTYKRQVLKCKRGNYTSNWTTCYHRLLQLTWLTGYSEATCWAASSTSLSYWSTSWISGYSEVACWVAFSASLSCWSTS